MICSLCLLTTAKKHTILPRVSVFLSTVWMYWYLFIIIIFKEFLYSALQKHSQSNHSWFKKSLQW